MRYKRLGWTGLKVSQLCLGANNFGTQVDEETTVRIIEQAVDSGINIIDTANIYTNGRSEELIGRAVRGNRDELIIATKVGMNMGDRPNRGGLSRKHILWQVRESLRRLQTDYIDVYYLHRYDPETPLEETLRTMDRLVKDGKVRYVACSNFTAAQLEEAKRVCDDLDLEGFSAVQPVYNLLQREIEKDLLPYCRQENLGVLTYSPLAGGFLTGKYRLGESPPSGSRGAANPLYWERIRNEGDFSRLDRLLALADGSKTPLHHLAVAWQLKNPSVTSVILGASRPEQVAENCRALEEGVQDRVLETLEKAAG